MLMLACFAGSLGMNCGTVQANDMAAGSIRVPVICVNFNDTVPKFTTKHLQDAFQGVLDIDMKKGWVEADYNEEGHDYYGEQWNREDGLHNWLTACRSAKLVQQAVEKADRSMDFSLFDYDKDGVVDLVVVVHQGEGYETSDNGADIMSHQWSLAEAGRYDATYGYGLQINPIMIDGVLIDKYLILPETQYGNLLSSAEIGRELEQPIQKTDDKGSDAGAGIGVIGALVNNGRNAKANTYVTISGYVMQNAKYGQPNVTLTFSGGQGTAITDSYGFYSKSVPYGWTGTVKPSMGNNTFDPSLRSYTNVAANQTGQNYMLLGVPVPKPPVTISGWVIASGFMAKNIRMVLQTAGNGAGTTVYTDSSGYYSAQVQYGWSGTITPSQTGYAFSPASKSVSKVTANLSQVNFMASLVSPVTISGRVTTPSGSGVCAVMNWSNGDQFCTDSGGNYSRQVPKGWSGTVTPSLSGYTFSPASRSYSNLTVNQANQNYMANYQVTFSGYVMTSAGARISGVTLSFGNAGGSVTTDANGYYSKKVAAGCNVIVTPTKSGYTFSPSSKSYTKVSANVWQCYTGTKK